MQDELKVLKTNITYSTSFTYSLQVKKMKIADPDVSTPTTTTTKHKAPMDSKITGIMQSLHT